MHQNNLIVLFIGQGCAFGAQSRAPSLPVSTTSELVLLGKHIEAASWVMCLSTNVQSISQEDLTQPRRAMTVYNYLAHIISVSVAKVLYVTKNMPFRCRNSSNQANVSLKATRDGTIQH